MKTRIIFAIAAMLLTLFVAEAQVQIRQREAIRLVYDVDYEMNFDNREFYESEFSKSMTIFGSRLTPSMGLTVHNAAGVTHSVMVGLDVMKEFGAPMSSPKDLIGEPILYYKLEKDCGRMDLELYAGMFSRKNSEGRYSEAFFSDSLKFYDNNLEGLLVKFRLPRAY